MRREWKRTEGTRRGKGKRREGEGREEKGREDKRREGKLENKLKTQKRGHHQFCLNYITMLLPIFNLPVSISKYSSDVHFSNQCIHNGKLHFCLSQPNYHKCSS